MRTESIVEFTQLWWSVRPHHDFGTVEVRICDAQTTAQEADQLAALIVACVRRAAEEVDAGEAPPDLPGRLIEENMWRAIRYGLDGKLLDLAAPRIEPYPASEALDRLRAWTGADVSAARPQRRTAPATDDRRRATPAEVYAATVRETHATYMQEEPVP